MRATSAGQVGVGGKEKSFLQQHTASPHELIIAHFHSRKYPPPRQLQTPKLAAV